MTDENQMVEADPQEVDATEVDVSQTDTHEAEDFQDAPESQGPETPESIRELAKSLGWKEPDEWVGDRTNYVSADKYLEIQQRRLARVQEQDAEIERLKRDFVALQKQATERFEKADQSNLEYLRAERDRAAELGDMKKYRELAKQVEDALKPKVQTEDPQEVYQRAVEQATADPVYQEWNRENSWYNGQSWQDQAKTILANQIAQSSGVDPLRLPPDQRRQFYDTVAQKVAEAYGEKRPLPARVPSSGNRSPARAPARGKGFMNLPGDAQDAFKTLVRKGVFKDTDKDKAEYAKMYLES